MSRIKNQICPLQECGSSLSPRTISTLPISNPTQSLLGRAVRTHAGPWAQGPRPPPGQQASTGPAECATTSRLGLGNMGRQVVIMSGLSKLLSMGPRKKVAYEKGLLCSSLRLRYRFFHHYQKAFPPCEILSLEVYSPGIASPISTGASGS